MIKPVLVNLSKSTTPFPMTHNDTLPPNWRRKLESPSFEDHQLFLVCWGVEDNHDLMTIRCTQPGCKHPTPKPWSALLRKTTSLLPLSTILRPKQISRRTLMKEPKSTIPNRRSRVENQIARPYQYWKAGYLWQRMDGQETTIAVIGHWQTKLGEHSLVLSYTFHLIWIYYRTY